MEDKSKELCICHNEDLTCTGVSTQCADVSTPIKLKPYAIIGNVETECLGKPIIALRSGQGINCCNGGGCEFTITQTICIKIPVKYGTTADVDTTTVTYKKSLNC